MFVYITYTKNKFFKCTVCKNYHSSDKTA